MPAYKNIEVLARNLHGVIHHGDRPITGSVENEAGVLYTHLDFIIGGMGTDAAEEVFFEAYEQSAGGFVDYALELLRVSKTLEQRDIEPLERKCGRFNQFYHDDRHGFRRVYILDQGARILEGRERMISRVRFSDDEKTLAKRLGLAESFRRFGTRSILGIYFDD